MLCVLFPFRPKFSQYRYLDDYRYNYYDDVLDYLDKRSKGISRDIPRPQYWAERVIRTNRKYVSLQLWFGTVGL